jgi:excisionase family DNA binding protein
MNEYLTVKQVSKKIHMSVGTIYNRLSAGKDMPATVQFGRRRLFPAQELEEWMKSRTASNDEVSVLGVRTGIIK